MNTQLEAMVARARALATDADNELYALLTDGIDLPPRQKRVLHSAIAEATGWHLPALREQEKVLRWIRDHFKPRGAR